MSNNCKIYVLTLAMLFSTLPAMAVELPRCTESDTLCREVETWAQSGQFEKIISRAAGRTELSAPTRHYIGQAYLALASAESNTSEQEEAYCRKALEFGATQAYMGLYFIHAAQNEAEALGYLRQYIATKPADSVPYVIVGETELRNGNYKLADYYLRESKKVARASSARVDWMLFQANYLLGNYQYASEMLERAVTSSQLDRELKALSADPRFHGIEKRPEFQKQRKWITASM